MVVLTDEQQQNLSELVKHLKSETIDIVLITHNQLESTKKCIEALYQNTIIPFRLIIVDDSDKPTQDYLKSLPKDNIQYIHPDVVIKSANHAMNIGIKYVKSDIFALLGNTTFVGERWLLGSLVLMRWDSKIGVMGFKTLNPETGLVVNTGALEETEGDSPDNWLITCETDRVSWAAVLLRKEAVEGLDENTYIGFRGIDDTDNCWEVVRRGWKIVFNGRSFVYHKPSSSVRDTEQKKVEVKENSMRFRRKWGYNLSESPNLDQLKEHFKVNPIIVNWK